MKVTKSMKRAGMDSKNSLHFKFQCFQLDIVTRRAMVRNCPRILNTVSYLSLVGFK